MFSDLDVTATAVVKSASITRGLVEVIGVPRGVGGMRPTARLNAIVLVVVATSVLDSISGDEQSRPRDARHFSRDGAGGFRPGDRRNPRRRTGLWHYWS